MLTEFMSFRQIILLVLSTMCIEEEISVNICTFKMFLNDSMDNFKSNCSNDEIWNLFNEKIQYGNTGCGVSSFRIQYHAWATKVQESPIFYTKKCLNLSKRNY